MDKVIIINRMYAGEYLEKGIGGGEVINLLHSDNGTHYCFINPVGMINPIYDNKVYAVIHTRLYEAGCFEVIGVSIIGNGKQLIHQKRYSQKENANNAANELKQYANKTQVEYGGVPYIKNSDKWPSITFKCERLLLPKKQIFILDSVYDKEVSSLFTTYKLKDTRFAKQSLHMYVNDEDNKESYNTLLEMINSDLWVERIIKIGDVSYKNHYNFLSLIHKEDDELAFSNMFSYFFSNYPILFKSFSKEVLNIDISDNYIIKREYHNIDLWVEDDKNIIVIENKIKSGINGISPRHDFSENGQVQSQLSKYYGFAKAEAESKKKKYHFFIFVPNYNKIDLKMYSASYYYTKIKYKAIYDFLVTKQVDDRYYKDFINSLYKHTKDVPVDYSEILLDYLIRQIKKDKEK